MSSAPRPPAYEAPPAGGFGAGPHPTAGFGPIQLHQVPGGARPAQRNAVVFGLLPFLLGYFGPLFLNFAAAAFDLYPLNLLGSLLQLGCVIWFFVNAMKALGDLQRATQTPSLPRWPIYVPLYHFFYWCAVVPAEVLKARAMRGMSPSHRSSLLYFFFPLFALQSDLNDL